MIFSSPIVLAGQIVEAVVRFSNQQKGMHFCFSLFTQVHLLTRVATMLGALSLRGICGLQLSSSMQDQLVEGNSQPYQMVVNVLMRMTAVLLGQPWENVREILCT